MSRPFVGIGVPMVVKFDRADVGRRVTLRRSLPEPEPGGASLGDVVGVLESWQDGVLTLRRRTGETVLVDAGTVVAGRVVAPEVSAGELDTYADDTWRADETEPLGAWRLRFHHNVTHRPNSALAVGDPGIPLTDTADAVSRWYAARGATPAVMTPVPSAVGDAYAALGWTQERETLVQAATLADVLDSAAAAAARDLGAVTVAEELPEDWDAVLPRLRDPVAAGPLRALLTSAPSAAFATLRDDDGAPLAVARLAVTRGWGNLTNVEVVEQARGRRLAASVIAALAAWAREQRATHMYLQMWPDNTSALRLYDRLGFTPHHRYAYFTPRVPQPPADETRRAGQPR